MAVRLLILTFLWSKSLLLFNNRLLIAALAVSCGNKQQSQQQANDSIVLDEGTAKQGESQQDEETQMRAKVDECASSIKADFVVKMYEIHKVVSANEGLVNDKKFVTITDALSGKEAKIVLKESEDYGPIVEMVALDNKKVMAKIHCGGSGPFYEGFTVDVENEKYVGHEELE